MTTLLQLTDSLSRRGGGVAESVLGLSQALRAVAPGQMSLAAGDDPDTDQDRHRFAPIPTSLFPVRRIGPLPMCPELVGHLRTHPPDLTHLHGVWGLASRALAQARHRLPRWMVSVHGMVEPWAMRRGRMKRTVAWRLWDGSVLQGASCLHALCEAEARSYRRLGLTQPVAVIPNGVMLPEAADRSRGDAFLFLGRLHPKKGIGTLIDAWSLLRDPPPLWIAGWDDHPEAAVWRRRVAESRLAGSITFLGPVAGTEKDRLFREARAFILPSHSEGLPMAVLEAWSHRVPVLMTDACHLPQGFDCGAAWRIGTDASSIADGVRSLSHLGEPERHRMGDAGRSLVERAFTWHQVAARFASVYAWLLGSGEKPEELLTPVHSP